MSFEELVENLVYSASISTMQLSVCAAPDALKWATDRMRARYGNDGFQRLMRRRAHKTLTKSGTETTACNSIPRP